MPKVNEEQQGQVNAGTEHHGVPRVETKPSPELKASASSQECTHGTYRSLCPECSDLS